MIWLDTDEKWNWFTSVIENDELQLVSRKLTEEDREEIRKEIAEYKTMKQKDNINKELVFA
jgi:hypothetical protein